MDNVRPILRFALVSLFTCGVAGCATHDPDRPMTNQGEERQFENYDRSGDDVLTRDELPSDSELLLGFDRYDLDGNGDISEYEFGEYLKILPR
jgi:hypothetical protein